MNTNTGKTYFEMTSTELISIIRSMTTNHPDYEIIRTLIAQKREIEKQYAGNIAAGNNGQWID